MTWEADLYEHLRTDSGIAAVVGSRIYPVILPQNSTKPAITYQEITGIPQTDLSGDDGDLQEIRLQIDCWAEGARAYTIAAELAELVRVRLQTAATNFHAVTNWRRVGYEDDARLYRGLLDVSIWYRN